jgi:predicted deacylase
MPTPGSNGFQIGATRVGPGRTRSTRLKVSESYTGSPVELPVRVVRAAQPGPAVFVTGAIHGDELNGAGTIRELALSPPTMLTRGTLVLVPVVNMLGFERHSRYMPDRRDPNRCFPGSAHGSLTARLAHTVFTEVVRKCDYGIDLHSAAAQRSNIPHVRADLTDPKAARIALAFGCELVVDGRGPVASLRRAACDAGVATIVLEAGEVWKMEPAAVEAGVRGVKNVLMELGMMEGPRVEPRYQAVAQRCIWTRAREGGLLRFHAAPGDLVEAGQPIASVTGLLGESYAEIEAPAEGVVMGMTTLPAVKPGDPVCHIAIVEGGVHRIRVALGRAPGQPVPGADGPAPERPAAARPRAATGRPTDP